MKKFLVAVAAFFLCANLYAVKVFSDTVVANLPTCASVTTGTVYYVTNGSSSTDCSTGGGSTGVVCVCNGTSWEAVGGAGGSGDITDVWGCSTGDCSALTAAAGDTVDATLADTTIPWRVDDATDPTTAGEVSFQPGNRRLAVGNGATTYYFYEGAFANTSFSTINAPSGTDPIADSGADALNLTSTGGTVTITGDSTIDTLNFEAVDLTCTNCIGGTEINESSLGDVPTATAFAANPSDCASSAYYANAIAANGNLTCLPLAASAVRPASILNARTSPDTDDCEFDGSVCAAWTVDASYSSGTVDQTIQQTTYIKDVASWPGWLLLQGDNSSATIKDVTHSYTPGTNEMWVFHVMASGALNATDEGRAGLCYLNSGDSNEAVCLGYHNAAGAERVEMYVNNNGGLSITCTMNSGAPPWPDLVFIIVKKGDVYSGGYISPYGGGGWGNTSETFCGSVTKTGVTTFDEVAFRVGTANETPSPVTGIDFARHYTAPTFAIMNP